jgi:hypothetical protein
MVIILFFKFIVVFNSDLDSVLVAAQKKNKDPWHEISGARMILIFIFYFSIINKIF